MTSTDKMNVLLIDDEIDFLSILIKRMRKRNINATAVSSGREALLFLAKNHVDCIVLDVRMPEMDGAKVLIEIKKLYPSIEVIMLTGHADMEVAIEVMEHGAFDYLMKPIDLTELLYKLQDAFEKKTMNQQKKSFKEEI